MPIRVGYWGNLFWGAKGYGGQYPIANFTSPSQIASIRCRARHTKVIVQVDLKFTVRTGGNLRIGIQRNSGGTPNGVWEGDTIINIYHGSPENNEISNNFWFKIPIGNVSVVAGEVIHIVVEPAQAVDLSLDGMPPNNKMQPFDLYEDDMMASLWNPGTGWVEPRSSVSYTVPFRDDVLNGVNPCYVIVYNDGTVEGCPYHTTWDGMRVYEGSCHGEMITNLIGDIVVDRIGFLIDRRGTPPDPLYLSVYDETGTPLIENLVFATIAEVAVGSWGVWIERTTTLNLKSGRKYQFLFSTIGGDPDNCWITMTEGAFGPFGNTDPSSYRIRLNFGGFDCSKLEGCDVPPRPQNHFYPDDLPFYLHYVTTQHTLILESNPNVEAVLDGVSIGVTPQTRQVAEGQHTPEAPLEVET